MRRLALVPLLAIASLLPLNAAAIGLGSIEMNSALNQRLDAEIPLHGVSPEQIDEVSVSLASERAFREAGLPRPFALSRLRFDVVERTGDLYVHATSTERVTEPYLSFLIEVDAPTGRLRREYTVLLDPPVYATEEAERDTRREEEREADVAAREPTPTELRRRQERFGEEAVFLEIERERDRIAEEAQRQAQEEEETRRRADEDVEPAPERDIADTELPETYTTRDGDTAWEIGARFARGQTSVQQMMMALLVHNPDAFVAENVNRLRSGYVLRIPPQAEAQAIDAQAAIAQVDRHNTLWREWRDQARRAVATPTEEPDVDIAETVAPVDEPTEELRIVGEREGGEVAADEDAPAAGTAELQEELVLAREQLESTQLERDELQSRVSELESTVDRMEQLIALREEQLAALQDRLVEIAESEGIELDPEMFPDEETVPDALAEADEPVDEDEPADEEIAADIDIVSQSEMLAQVGRAAAARSDALTAQAEADEEQDEAVAVAADPGLETVRTQPEDQGLLGRMVAPMAAALSAGLGALAGPIGIVLVLVVAAGLGAFFYFNRQREDSDEDLAAEEGADEGDMATADGFEDLIGDDDFGDDIDIDDFDHEGDTPAGDERRLGGNEGLTDEDPLAVLDEDPGMSGDAEKDDTIAEADVYLAYGLHQQAKDLLELALEESPERADYHEKLLETLYAAGETAEFETRAAQFHGMLEPGQEGLWKRVVAMGQEVAPANALFRDGDSSGVSPADFQPTKPQKTDFDLGDDDWSELAADGAGSDDVESADATDSEMDDDLLSGLEDEFEQMLAEADDDTGADQRSAQAKGEPSSPPEEVAVSRNDFDDLLAATDDDGDGGPAAEEQADDDDLEFDLGDLDDLSPDEPQQETRTQEPADEMDDDLEFDLADFEPADAEPESATAVAEDNLLEPTDTAQPETAAASDDDEFDLEDFSADLLDDEFEAGGSPEDADKTSASAAETEFDTDDLEPADRPASAQETVSTDEVDDLEFDIDDLEPADSPASAQEAASDDEADDLEFGIDDLEPADSAPAEPVAARADDSDALDLSDFDLDTEGEGPAETAGQDDARATNEEEAQPTDEAADFDLFDEFEEPTDSAEISATPTAADSASELDLDEFVPSEDEVESARATASGPSMSASLAAAEDDVPEDDELDTMLDLARAYMDLGDHESATNALEEVIEGGNSNQRAEAQKLLDSAR